MNLLEKATRILEQPICDRCLGRQFGQLLHGYSNEERGKLMRMLVAMSIDKENYSVPLNMKNFSGFQFHNLEEKPQGSEKCVVCNDIFSEIKNYVEKIKNISKNYEFKTFLVGTKLSFDLIKNEENLWERVGIDYCEPLKAELNREIGKRLEKALRIKADLKRPDVNFIIDVNSKKVAMEPNPLFIYGEYQKWKRGIPQTKWPSGKYKNSVEQIIAKPFMQATKGSAHKLHGAGREDIDARCIAWRPFVLEIIGPKKRFLNLKKFSAKIKKGVKVKNMRYSDIAEVRKIKDMRLDKTYRLFVQCKNIRKNDLNKLKALVGTVNQKTPSRVLHRRSDKFRKRKIKKIKTKIINSKKFMLEVVCESGLYVKELVTGDNMRTKPSVAHILGMECKPLMLDVIKIHRK